MSAPVIADGTASFSRLAQAQLVPPEAVDRMLEHLPVGLILVDRDGRAVYENAAARALDIERLDPLQWTITRALLTEDPVREDDIQVAALGEPRRWLSVYVTPVRVQGVGVTAAFVMLSDVTARSRMNAWAPMIETLTNL